jgi:hypothetical protein
VSRPVFEDGWCMRAGKRLGKTIALSNSSVISKKKLVNTLSSRTSTLRPLITRAIASALQRPSEGSEEAGTGICASANSRSGSTGVWVGVDRTGQIVTEVPLACMEQSFRKSAHCHPVKGAANGLPLSKQH